MNYFNFSIYQFSLSGIIFTIDYYNEGSIYRPSGYSDLLIVSIPILFLLTAFILISSLYSYSNPTGLKNKSLLFILIFMLSCLLAGIIIGDANHPSYSNS